jgi:hypothetical protein
MAGKGQLATAPLARLSDYSSWNEATFFGGFSSDADAPENEPARAGGGAPDGACVLGGISSKA